ncbi:MAG: type I restriction enzyme HsdR N-terminal domain-containing protein [Alistipes sp.]|nr:type I restriction enzyme HsdR N-terminal domain-containing protein [Alistipes sp.]
MENKLPKLNFPAIKLRAQERDGYTMVYDSVRNMYVVLTPEEWVRRHLVEYLVTYCKVPLRSIVEEYPVALNGMAQRADVVVMDSQARPLILAECKAPEIKLTQDTILQATRYNAVVGARYIILTNGMKHFCYERGESGYVPLSSFPAFE